MGPPVGPPSGALNTTIVLEVFYQEGKKGKLHLDCTGSQLVYTAAVRGPTATQVGIPPGSHSAGSTESCWWVLSS